MHFTDRNADSILGAFPDQHHGVALMDFEFSPKVKDLQARLLAFMNEHV